MKSRRLFVILVLLFAFGFGEIPFDTVRIRSTDGVSLSGRRFDSGPDWVILAHMFPVDQTSWFPFAETLAGRGFTALTFDFRGYGKSEGKKEVAKIDRDVVGAIRYAKSGGAKRIVLIGASMGGTAALKVAATEPVDGVVALSPPMIFMGLSSEEALPRLTIPKLFMVSEKEMNVSVQSVRRQFQKAPEPKALEILPGSAHGSRMLEEEGGKQAEGLILEFLHRTLK
jgi:pimeloyl-ACP methyl ester carboxylesterase